MNDAITSLQNEELNNYLNKEAEAERHTEELEAIIAVRAKDMMLEGEWCYPWSFTNFTEAIENAPVVDRRVLCAYVGAAHNRGLTNEILNKWAVTELCNMVEKYWHDAAVADLRKEYQL